MEIPYPEPLEKNEICEIKIYNLYSPSRFWVVVNYRGLKVFTNYLTHYYKQRRILLNKIAKLQVCIVFQKALYYRAIILPVTFYNKNKIRVFLLDYGIFTHVTLEDLICIEEKHLKVSRFAYRCCLAYIKNLDYSKPWTISALQTLCEIVTNQQIYMKLHEQDVRHKTFYVDIFRKCKNSLESCSTLLVSLGQATFTSNESDTKTEDTDFRYRRLLKFMHLFPSFQSLERGEVPCSLWEHNLLKDCLPKDVLYKNYYEFIQNGEE